MGPGYNRVVNNCQAYYFLSLLVYTVINISKTNKKKISSFRNFFQVFQILVWSPMFFPRDLYKLDRRGGSGRDVAGCPAALFS